MKPSAIRITGNTIMNTQETGIVRQAKMETVAFPDIGYPREPRPELDPAVFRRRLARTRARMRRDGLDALVVYGDREHFANVHYLTWYDPRFEETLLVIRPSGTPALLVGNEGMGYSGIARLPVERRLYQTFSLLGQPRERVRLLHEVLAEAGLKGCRRVGVAGWKYFTPAESPDPAHTLEIPEFIAAAIRAAAGRRSEVTNETRLLMDPETGLRSVNEPEQLADFEWVATCNSQALLDGIRALRPGMSEQEAFAGMRMNGMPLCCHPVCSAAGRLRASGMPSATSARIRRGDPIFMSLSYQGANTGRFGWVARAARELPAAARDYVDSVAAPYALALAAWYEAMGAGASVQALHHAADGLRQAGFGLALNIGHQIAYDEWTDSPVAEHSHRVVPSGSYWQADFFATLPAAHYGAFAEDGLAVADARLRATLRRRYPLMWKRIVRRQRFLRETLGIRIGDDVLPFSNFPAAVMPFFLSPSACMTLRQIGRSRRPGGVSI